MLLGLTAGQKLGLLLAAAVFIVFALASSFLFPRRNPDFPGDRGLRLFVPAVVALFVGMMAAMFFLAREEEEEGRHEESAALLQRR